MPEEQAPEQVSGETLSRITSSIVALYREHFGRGPTAAKTYALDDVIVCVLRNGLTVIERTLFNGGKADTVRTMRAAFQVFFLDRPVAQFAVNEEIVTTDVVDQHGDRTDVEESA